MAFLFFSKFTAIIIERKVIEMERIYHITESEYYKIVEEAYNEGYRAGKNDKGKELTLSNFDDFSYAMTNLKSLKLG